MQAWRSLTASSKTSTRCGAGAAGTILASGADRALQLGLRILAACAPGRRGAPVPAAAAAGPPGTAWRSLPASSRTLTRCGAGAAGMLLASGADRALQLELRIRAGVRTWSPRTSAACCSWITKCCTAFGWNVVSVLLESNKAKNQRTDQQMQGKGSSTSPRGFERSELGQDMRR